MNTKPGIQPHQSIWRRLDMMARLSFPTASTLIATIAFAAPLGLPGQPEIQMAVALSCVYFWSLYRPASMPPPVVFLLGVLTDLIAFSPVGVSVLILLIVHGLAMRWRRDLVRQGFLVVWLVFIGVASAAATLGWALTALLTFRLLPPGPGMFLAMLGAGLYPAIATMLTLAHQTLAEPEHA